MYKNKNGNMEIEDFIKLIHNGIDNYLKEYSPLNDMCPPVKLIDDKILCFYCGECWVNCLAQVKEYKDYYKVGNKKYPKNELSKEELCE